MPQLSIETFFSQYFWLIVILGLFYISSITLFIPRIASIFKTRQRLETSDQDTKIENQVIPSELEKAENFSSQVLNLHSRMTSDSITSVSSFSEYTKTLSNTSKIWVQTQ